MEVAKDVACLPKPELQHGIPAMITRQKTGVLTFHRCINYGSYWQARCLVEGLRARGHDAEIVDHESRRISLAEWKCALQPVLPAFVPIRDRILYGVKILKFMSAFSSLPLSPRFSLENPVNMENYDLVIVGSDEVWNLRHPWYGGWSLFFGDGVRARRLATYAASFGNYDASEGLAPAWADRLRRFESISVRDENSRNIIRNALGLDPKLVLDPCLQFPLQPAGQWRGPTRPFIAVYGHSFSPTFGSAVRRWATSHNYPLVSIGYRNPWADVHWITAGPRDFAQAMARATAVATNFFHGCVFALRNGRPFVCEPSSYRATKIQGLLAMIGGGKRLVSEYTPTAVYDACLGQPLDSEILHRLDDLRRSTAAYLDRVLDPACHGPEDHSQNDVRVTAPIDRAA